MASIGLRGLEEIEHFPQPGLVVCFGGPGTGKTALALSFVEEGAALDEKSVFVSFVEGRDQILEYADLFGYELRKFESQGVIKIVEIPALTSGPIDFIMKSILDEVSKSGAKRLVLDSFTAIEPLIEESTRSFLHNIFSKVLRSSGVTTLITLERRSMLHIPTVEEYVADVVIELAQNLARDEPFTRELIVHKFRGGYLSQKRYAFTLHKGFTVFPPLLKLVKEAELPELLEEVEVLSTGMKELDIIIGGGLKPGSYVVLTFRTAAPFQSFIIVTPMVLQSVMKGRGVIILPPMGLSAQLIKAHLSKVLSEEDLKEKVRIIEFGRATKEEWVVNLDGKLEHDMEKVRSVHISLKEKTGKPVLRVMGPNRAYTIYGEKGIRPFIEDVSWVRSLEDFRVDIGWFETPMMRNLVPISDVHFDFFELNGALFMRGIKPKTAVFNVKEVAREGKRFVEFTPVV